MNTYKRKQTLILQTDTSTILKYASLKYSSHIRVRSLTVQITPNRHLQNLLLFFRQRSLGILSWNMLIAEGPEKWGELEDSPSLASWANVLPANLTSPGDPK